MTYKIKKINASHLGVDPLGEGRAGLGRAVVGRARVSRARPWLHGDQLHLVGRSSGAVR